MSADRFWSKVDKSGGLEACWIWTAHRNKRGYGQFRVSRKTVYAHRYAYELANGPIPDGLHGLHRCDNPPCCNPAHIFIGTNAENVADRNAKGRQACLRGEWNGRAKLTEAQVAEIRGAYDAGGVTLHELGNRFGMSHVAIHLIVRRKRWALKLPASSEGTYPGPAAPQAGSEPG